MDNIISIFSEQLEFTKKIFKEKYGLDVENLSREERVKWSKEFILCMTKEGMEMLDELNWKTHRVSNKSDNIDSFAEEGIDVFKFLLNLMIINGITPQIFSKKFYEKTKIVDIRYEQEKSLQRISKNDKFIVVDIDGVLNNYPIQYYDYVKNHFSMVPGELDNVSFSDFRIKYPVDHKQIKTEFRVKGKERENVARFEVINFFKENFLDYKIILLTSRPYKKYPRLFYDTYEFLKFFDVRYDYVFFDENKEDFLIDNFNKEQISFVVDDEIENVNKLCNYFKTYLLRNQNLYTNVLTVSDEVTIISEINDLLLSRPDSL